MTTTLDTTNLIDGLGLAIAAQGIDADPTSLHLLADAARELGVSGVLVDVMVDRAESSAARVRAFARVSTTVSVALHEAVAARGALRLAC